jgi:hypothetical protein
MENSIVELKLRLSAYSNISDDIQTLIELADTLELAPYDYDRLLSILNGIKYLYEERVRLTNEAFSQVADELYAYKGNANAATNHYNTTSAGTRDTNKIEWRITK